MKTKYSRILPVAAVAMLEMFSTGAYAMPSGFLSVPPIQRPKYQGRTLPVDILADQSDPKTLWVVPKEGEFINQGAIKSPAVDCSAMKKSLELEEVANQATGQLLRSFKAAQADYDQKEKKYRTMSEKRGRLEGLQPALAAAVTSLTTKVTTQLAEYAALKRERDTLEQNILLDEDKISAGEKRVELEEKKNELAAKRRAIAKLQKEKGEKEAELTEVELELAALTGSVTGIQADLDRLNTRIATNKPIIDAFLTSTDAILARYSNRVGGYTSFTAEFAPSVFLQLLENANKGYSFRYVTSITATVDASIPESVVPGSAAQTGTLVMAAKWSDPRGDQLREYYKAMDMLKSFPKELFSGKDSREFLPAIVKHTQDKLDESRRAEFESSLSGSKFLALKLSALGYCALKEPETLKSQGGPVGGAKDTFKLAMHFTYPVHYQVDVDGKFNSTSYLRDFWEMTKKSSWFGLSKEQKLLHTTDLTKKSTMEITVTPRGAALTNTQSDALRDLVKGQITFAAAQPFLDNKGNTTPTATFDNEDLGASKVGNRLMLVPNPWAFWGGLILTSLSEMFGSSTQTSETIVNTSSTEEIHYKNGFTFMIPGDITIGDLQRSKEEVREIK